MTIKIGWRDCGGMQGWGGGGDYFWASENWSGQVHFEGHSAEWRVPSKLTVRPCYAQDTFGQNDFGLMWGGHTT